MKLEQCYEMWPPDIDPRYTHQANHDMGRDRPNTEFLTPESNPDTTNKPGESGLVSRQPL